MREKYTRQLKDRAAGPNGEDLAPISIVSCCDPTALKELCKYVLDRPYEGDGAATD